MILVLVCSLANVTQSRPAGMHEWLQVAAIETAVSETDIFASSTCNLNILNFVHMEMLKNNAFVGNTRQFDTGSEVFEGMKIDDVGFVFSVSHGVFVPA